MNPPPSAEEVVRDAEPADVAAIGAFGEAHICPHYTPLIGAAAADAQVRRWWNEAQISTAVADGLVVVADAGGQLVGVGQRGRSRRVLRAGRLSGRADRTEPDRRAGARPGLAGTPASLKSRRRP